jgi:hypothetical protein
VLLVVDLQCQKTRCQAMRDMRPPHARDEVVARAFSCLFVYTRKNQFGALCHFKYCSSLL